MIAAVRPQQLAHRGVVEAAGVLIDPLLCGEPVARGRVLSLWSPGMRVYALGRHLLVQFAQPRTLDTRASPGTPLVRFSRGLTAAPLTSREQSALTLSGDSLVLLEAGEARISTQFGAAVDPSEWISTDQFQLRELPALGAPPPAIALPAPVEINVRARLGVPPASGDQSEIIAALDRTAPPAARKRPGLFARGFLRLLDVLARHDRELTSSLNSESTALAAPRPPSALGSLLSRVQQWARGRIARSQLGSWLHQRQAEYMARLFNMLEAGDLDEALRHAVPLGKEGSTPTPPALGVPQPRDSLAISRAKVAAAAGLAGSNRFFEELRARYRQLFEKLDQQDRFEEAAFVLIELMNDVAAGIAYLEKHHRFQEAAEIAEGRNLPPALVIRQWILAGNWRRAIDIARRTGAYVDAFTLMERRDPEAANRFRLLWADHLATSGDYAGAVDVIWPDPSARNLAVTWLESAIEVGGPVGARMLARRLELQPERYSDVLARVLPLLEDRDPAGFPAHRSLADTVTAALGRPNVHSAQAHTALRVVARPLIRALLRDASESQSVEREALRRSMTNLLAVAFDSTLREDLPPLTHAGPYLWLAQRASPDRLTFDAGDVGRTPIFDAAMLSSGRILVALGEAGARLLTADGRTIAHFDRPAHTLVISDRGDSALALAPRDETQLVARLDLARRTSRPWAEARITAWAPSHDGSSWFVAQGERVFALDLAAERLQAGWEVRAGAPVDSITRSPGWVSFVTRVVTREWDDNRPMADAPEAWTYELPSMVLRHRRPFEGIDPELVLHRQPVASPSGHALDVMMLQRPEGGAQATFEYRSVLHALGERDPVPFGVPEALVARLQRATLSEGWAVAVGEAKLFVIPVATKTPCLEVTLEGSQEIRTRLDDRTLVVADERGRLLAFDLQSGSLWRDLRL